MGWIRIGPNPVRSCGVVKRNCREEAERQLLLCNRFFLFLHFLATLLTCNRTIDVLDQSLYSQLIHIKVWTKNLNVSLRLCSSIYSQTC